MLFTSLVVSVIIAFIGTIRIIRNRDWKKAVLRKAAARDERARALGKDVKIDIGSETPDWGSRNFNPMDISYMPIHHIDIDHNDI
jgi:hypothetical protein